MRKPKFPPPIYAHKATGQARCRVEGRDIYLGKHGSPEAAAAYARLVTELSAGRTEPPRAARGDAPVAEVVAEWLAGPGAKYATTGNQIRQYRIAFRPLLRLYGPTPAGEFKSDQLESLRMAMATGSWMTDKEKKASRRPDWCAAVVNRACGRIKCLFRWAERKGYVPEGRWHHLCALPGLAGNDASVRHSAGWKACTEGELNLVLAQCLRPVKAMLQLQYLTGMRSGEVRIMRPCDIDRSGEVWVFAPHKHKNDWRGQKRLVPLGPACQAVLLPFLADCEAGQYLFRPTLRFSKDHYGCDTYAQAVRRAALAAGVPHFHPYSCRHAAKERIAREFGLEAARAMLGHKSCSTTAMYSSETDLKLAAEVAKKAG